MSRPRKLQVVFGSIALIGFAASMTIILIVSLHFFSNSLATSPKSQILGTSACILDVGTNVGKDLSNPSFCTILIWFTVAASLFYGLLSILVSCGLCNFTLSYAILIAANLFLSISWFVVFGLTVHKSNAAANAGYGLGGYRVGVLVAEFIAALAPIAEASVLIYLLRRNALFQEEDKPQAEET